MAEGPGAIRKPKANCFERNRRSEQHSNMLVVVLSFLCLCPIVMSRRWPGPNTCSICSCEIKTRVRYANCSSRNLITIPDDLPVELDELDLSNNSLWVSELSKLNRFEHLKKLSVAYNNIKVVPTMIFSNASRLQELDMSGNLLDIVDEDTFKNLLYLRVIKGLETQNIVENSFVGHVSLHELELTLHSPSIPEDLFDDLNINSLHLILTDVVSLPLNLFRFGSKSLAILKIEGPKISDFQEDIFYGLSVLNTIILRTPNVYYLPTYIFHREESENSMPINLVKIVIDGVKSLPRNIFQKQLSLEIVELHGIEDIPSDLFDGVKSLDHLDLSRCNVYHISSEWFSSLSSLKTLNLSRTDLMTIDADSLNGLNSLTTLDLSYNHIENINPLAFRHFRFTLLALNLTGNQITAFKKGTFTDLRLLENLDLSSNKLKLSRLDKYIFWDLKKLKYLYMQDNILNYLPNTMLYSQSDLEHLNLASNNLTQLPRELLRQTIALRHLDLSGNHIGKIPDDFISNLWFLEEFKLLNNPLHCDCDMMALRESLGEAKMFGVCLSPPDLVGVSLLNLTTDPNCYLVSSSSANYYLSTTHTQTANILIPEIMNTKYIDSSADGFVMATKTGVMATPTLQWQNENDRDYHPDVKTVNWNPSSLAIIKSSVFPSYPSSDFPGFDGKIPELNVGAGRDNIETFAFGNPFYIALAAGACVVIIGAVVVGVLLARRRLRNRSYEVSSQENVANMSNVSEDQGETTNTEETVKIEDIHFSE